MREQELWKKVPIYFYYLSISKHKDAKDDSAYSTDQIIIAFSQLLEYIMTKGLSERKKDITSSEKVVWLDSYEDLKNGNYDVIFKSAKSSSAVTPMALSDAAIAANKPTTRFVLTGRLPTNLPV